MRLLSSPAPRRTHGSGFALLAIFVLLATAIYGFWLNQPWPS